MIKQLAFKWANNLASNKFKQGKGRLRQKEYKITKTGKTKETLHYCCLGVLGQVCGLDDDALDYNDLLDGYAQDVGIGSDDGRPRDGSDIKIRKGNKVCTYSSLAEANDDGVTFRSIAAWIKRNYKKL